MKVDLLVCNHNSRSLLERLLNTLHSDYEPDVWTLTIADNGSTDGSVEWLKQLAVTGNYQVSNIYFNENIGYARAINKMAADTSNDILCAVNADTWFTTKHVKDVINFFEENPNVAIAGPKQMDEQSRIRHAGIYWAGKKAYHPKHMGWERKDPQDLMYKEDHPCWTVSGSLYYIRRKVWNAIAEWEPYKSLGFNPKQYHCMPEFDLYYEETLVSQLAHHLGYEVWYNGTSETAGHSWSGSKADLKTLSQLAAKSRAQYIYICDKLGIPHEC